MAARPGHHCQSYVRCTECEPDRWPRLPHYRERRGFHRARLPRIAGARRAAQDGGARHHASADRSSEAHPHLEIDAVIAPVLAAQAAADESKRRADWRRVENSAVEFASG